MNAQMIWNHLIAAGLSPQGAAGLMGNLRAESNLDPQNLQNSFEGKLNHTNASYTAAVDNGSYTAFATDGAGYGLAQWTHRDRKQRMLIYARTMCPGCSIGDLEMQLRFLCYELNGYYPGIWGALRNTSDVRYASDLVLTQYERPADQGEKQAEKRYAFSMEYYNTYAKEGEPMPTANEKRLSVVDKYKSILGRNKYSQPRRSYCYKKYSDGKYYSDCSSSIALTYKEAGYPFYDNNGSYNPNTVGMYQAKSLHDVPVEIVKGIIQNPEILCPGDMLLFAGSDKSRKYADYVGHVEMVAKVEGSEVTLYGHGSGTPRAIEMNKYCKSRYSSKTSTAKGNKGLLKVRRFIMDDGAVEPVKPIENGVTVASGTWNVRTGPGTEYESVGTVRGGERYPKVEPGEWEPIEYDGAVRWIGPNAIQK